MPRYTADIAEVFEIVDRPDNKGKCLRQVIPVPPISWAPEWLPFTILGDDQWQDYEVSADVYLNPGDSAGVMGRINHVGTGYGSIPKGYFLQLADNGKCDLILIRGKKDKKKVVGDVEQQAIIKAGKDDSEGGEKILGTIQLPNRGFNQWHNLKLRFEGFTVTGLVDDQPVLSATDTLYSHGMAGLMAGGEKKKLSTPYFDNVLINAANAPAPKPSSAAPGQSPIYGNSSQSKRTSIADETTKQTLPVNFFKNLQAGKKQTVVVYGTSLSHTAEWPKALKEYLDQQFPGQVNFINSASSGKESNWGVANLAKRVLTNQPDLVFIEFSINDAATKHNISTEKSAANLDRIVKALRQQNPQVDIVLQTMSTVWDSPAEPPDRAAAKARPHLDDYYEVYRKYAREHGLPLVDHYPSWLKLQQEDEGKYKQWLPDGTHPIPEASLAVTLPAIEALLKKAQLSGKQFEANSPARLSVRDFGAVGDGNALDTAAIQKALDAAAKSGGGEVRVPAGRYLAGSLVLKSHTTLHLDAGTSLLGCSNRNDYPIVRARWEGIETNCHRALISADHAEDIAITGPGVIEGNPAVGCLRNPRGSCVVEMIECSNVRIEGVTLKSSRMWTLHPTYCRDVRILGVTFETTGANSDGIDPDSCKRVTIDGCTFSTGDDNIAIKSGKGQEGVRIGRPSEDIVITNCTFIKGYTSIAMGSELSGGIRRVRISHCMFKQERAALQLKSREGRGGYLEDIIAEHLVVGPEPLLELDNNYKYNPDPQGVTGSDGLTRFSNIRITDVKMDSKNLLTIIGTTEKPVDGIQISRVTGTCKEGSVIQNATNVILSDILLTGISGPLYFTNNVSGSGLEEPAPIKELPPPTK